MLGDVGAPSGIQPRDAQRVDAKNTSVYLQFYAAFSKVALVPHAIRRPHAESVGTKSRLDSRKWVARQARDYLHR